MANIIISDLQPVELEYAELSDLELESVAGGKCEIYVDGPGDSYMYLKGKECRAYLKL